MSTIWERTGAALASITIPMAADSFIVESSQELPDQYMTYGLVDSAGRKHYDDDEKLRQYRVQLSLYSRSGLQAADLAPIVAAMKAAGFKRGPETPLPYVESTRHYGLAMDWFFLEQE